MLRHTDPKTLKGSQTAIVVRSTRRTTKPRFKFGSGSFPAKVERKSLTLFHFKDFHSVRYKYVILGTSLYYVFLEKYSFFDLLKIPRKYRFLGVRKKAMPSYRFLHS